MQVHPLTELEVGRLHPGDGGEVEDLVELTVCEAGKVNGILDRPFQVLDARQIGPLWEAEVGGHEAVLAPKPKRQPADQRPADEPCRSGHEDVQARLFLLLRPAPPPTRRALRHSKAAPSSARIGRRVEQGGA